VSGRRLRSAVRALVLDERDRVLLVRMGSGEQAVWVTPGGGIEPGESEEHALRRELLEEAGLDSFDLGTHVWTRTAHLPLGGGRWDGELERVYLVRVSGFEPAPCLSWAELRAESMTAIRWWTLSELEESGALFAPRRLPGLVRELLGHGPSEEPSDGSD